MADGGNFKIGYAKPPRQTQFKKGVSGNPKGRPKKVETMPDILQAVCNERVRVVINGKVRRISKLHAAIMQLANKAFSGDTRSILEMLKSYQQNAREMSRQALNPQLQALVDALNAGPVEK